MQALESLLGGHFKLVSKLLIKTSTFTPNFSDSVPDVFIASRLAESEKDTQEQSEQDNYAKNDRGDAKRCWRGSLCALSGSISPAVILTSEYRTNTAIDGADFVGERSMIDLVQSFIDKVSMPVSLAELVKEMKVR